MRLPWKPHTELPARLPATALIAVRDYSSGDLFLLNGRVYEMLPREPGAWCLEGTRIRLKEREFWWLAEEELFR